MLESPPVRLADRRGLLGRGDAPEKPTVIAITWCSDDELVAEVLGPRLLSSSGSSKVPFPRIRYFLDAPRDQNQRYPCFLRWREVTIPGLPTEPSERQVFALIFRDLVAALQPTARGGPRGVGRTVRCYWAEGEMLQTSIERARSQRVSYR